MKTRREKNNKRRTIRRVFKKILHSRTSRIKMKMNLEIRDWKGGVKLEEKEEDEDKRKKMKARLKEEEYEVTTGIIFTSCLRW